MAQLRRDLPQLQAANAQVVLIGLGTPAEAHAFRAKMELPFPVLSDPDKTSYALYDLAARLDVGSELRAGKALQFVADVARYGVAKTDQDILQLGGVFAVDQAGIIRFVHRARLATDYPRTRAILQSFADQASDRT